MLSNPECVTYHLESKKTRSPDKMRKGYLLVSSSRTFFAADDNFPQTFLARREFSLATFDRMRTAFLLSHPHRFSSSIMYNNVKQSLIRSVPAVNMFCA